ncbi:SMI1/KNR4 family protein [Jannaschia sp. LMIT008]|uniref:SMI1/KNR4 family protein n=1 Tax=Jannaschia maritima TaxID=3032585 RepID=UPI00281102ED|nr:SMI1/KNR4 family protein [Jannaschia sp. LMIT008]
MSGINWNPDWQLSEPSEFDFNPDGSITLRDPLNDVFLTRDYIEFMQRSNGAGLRDTGSWFMARFDEGVVLLQVEWLGNTRNLDLTTRSYYRHLDPDTHLLPLKHVFIGFADPVNPEGADIVMNVQKGDPDYGKIYAWIRANDPWMTGDNTHGLGHVADSFTGFMNGLTERENL